MQIVFHAGFHKTGTTSLQSAMKAHAAALAPDFHIEIRETNPRFVSAAEAARSYSAKPGPATMSALERALQDWVAGLPEAVGILASSEDFAGHMPSRFGIRDYRAIGAIVPAVVATLRARFATAEIKVLVTTRAAVPWLRSIHWQLSKHPQLKLNLAAFSRKFAGAADFDAVLGPLRAGLGPQAQLTTVPLEVLTGRLGPVEVMYDLARVPADLRHSLAVMPRQNQSPEVALADPFVELNCSGLPAAEIREMKRDMRAVMAQIMDET